MLISKTQFSGIDNVVHLATGGESPMLKSHQGAIERFIHDKSQGEKARWLFDQTYERTKAKAARLLSVQPEEVCFLSSVSEGVNVLAHALDWQAGDNVIIADVEFPSGVLPWTTLTKLGVEVRVVRHQNWQVQLDDLAALMDARTRVVAISQVSYFTGQRQDIAALSQLVRSAQALLLVDATHAAGAIPVEAQHADILVSSCYKWLLGVHGAAIFYWNKQRLPELMPPFLGWNTGAILPSWEDPLSYELPASADRFVPGNPSFISLYILENALDKLLELGPDQIEAHVLSLSERTWHGLQEAGWELLTPAESERRAGNTCFIAEDVDRVVQGLADQGVLIWGAYGGVNRIRVSTHLYNTSEDVDIFLQVLQQLRGA